MYGTEYLYLGGPRDGQWRVPTGGSPMPGELTPEEWRDENTGELHTYVPTKFGQMADAGEFRMQCVVMLELSLHVVLSNLKHEPGPEEGYRRRLERAILHRAWREHLQRIWRTPETLDFGVAWHVFERRPAAVDSRPIRDNPQA